MTIMKIYTSQNIQAEIKKVIEVILREIELRDAKSVNGAIPVQVLSKKFEHPEDLELIVQKINNGEASAVLCICEEYELSKSLYWKFIATEVEIRKMKNFVLKGVKETFMGEKEYFYFLIYDICRLEKINTELQNGESLPKENTTQKNKNVDELICVRPNLGHKFKIIINGNYNLNNP